MELQRPHWLKKTSLDTTHQASPRNRSQTDGWSAFGGELPPHRLHRWSVEERRVVPTSLQKPPQTHPQKFDASISEPASVLNLTQKTSSGVLFGRPVRLRLLEPMPSARNATCNRPTPTVHVHLGDSMVVVELVGGEGPKTKRSSAREAGGEEDQGRRLGLLGCLFWETPNLFHGQRCVSNTCLTTRF